MKVLVVGNGGREHALAWKIRQSPLVKEVYCAPGNAGMETIADCVPIDTSNIVEVADFAQTIKADLTVVGPELPMVLGMGDEFQRRGMAIFCPSRAAAEIEGSKAFAREFMRRHKIPAPRYELCDSAEAARDFVKRAPFGYPIVIKADGLASGKGTVVATNAAEAKACVEHMMVDRRFGNAGARLVMEEFLEGEELSFLVFSDGSRVVPMTSVQDHKRVGDNDTGDNTGGMGTVSPSTSLTLDAHKQVMHEIILPTVKGLAAEGRRYQGVLYAGLMITAQGPRVLEFNARFGDPETQAVLPRLRSDLGDLMLAAREPGGLAGARAEFSEDWAVTLVLASAGYPASSSKGDVISGLAEAAALAELTHAGTAERDGEIVTAGGRVLNVTGLGPTPASARETAYSAASRISFEGMQIRTDIAARAAERVPG
jgi:phosphoribosylamine--glycine ligase